jgi:hypothetical protein
MAALLVDGTFPPPVRSTRERDNAFDQPLRHHPTRAPRRHRARAVYIRRRLVAGALAIGLVLVAGQAAAALGGSSLAPTGRRPHTQTVVVEPGDSLWSIAQRVAPDRDPREVVDALVQARGTATVVPGETVTWVND